MSDKSHTRPGRNGGTLKIGGSPGRPKGSLSLTEILRRELNKNGKEKAGKLVDAWIMQAIEGNGPISKIIIDRVDGVIKEELELSGGLTVKVEYGDADISEAAHGPEATSE